MYIYIFEWYLAFLRVIPRAHVVLTRIPLGFSPLCFIDLAHHSAFGGLCNNQSVALERSTVRHPYTYPPLTRNRNLFRFVARFIATLHPSSVVLAPRVPRRPPLHRPWRQVLLHIRTEKGMGYPPAMAASDKYHGVAKFNVATGKQHKGVSRGPERGSEMQMRYG